MWGVPADHKMFSDINNAQWMWYYNHMLEDSKEKFESRRDMVEYHASFIEPEAVQKIRKARENAVEVTHEDFTAGIEQTFGRKIGISREKRKGVESHDVTSQGVRSKKVPE